MRWIVKMHKCIAWPSHSFIFISSPLTKEGENSARLSHNPCHKWPPADRAWKWSAWFTIANLYSIEFLQSWQIKKKIEIQCTKLGLSMKPISHKHNCQSRFSFRFRSPFSSAPDTNMKWKLFIIATILLVQRFISSIKSRLTWLE